MALPRRRVLILALVVALLAVVAAVALWVVRARAETRFAEAVGLLPASTARVTWTDWAAVRAELDAEDPDPDQTQALVDEALERDLATPSVLASSAPLVREYLGLDPALVEWEAFGQSSDGAVLVVKLPDGVDVDELTKTWQKAGYAEPASDKRDGATWALGPDAELASLLGTSPLRNLALLEDERLVLASDSRDYLAQSVEVASGEKDGLDVGALTEAFEEPVAAIGLLGDQACSALSLSASDPGVAAEGEALVEQAGGVAPLTGYLVALLPGDRIGFAFDHENAGQATRDAKSRRALAGAEDPGQMLPYPDLFTIDSAVAEQTLTVLEGDTVPDAYPLSNTSSGPVLLATC